MRIEKGRNLKKGCEIRVYIGHLSPLLLLAKDLSFFDKGFQVKQKKRLTELTGGFQAYPSTPI